MGLAKAGMRAEVTELPTIGVSSDPFRFVGVFCFKTLGTLTESFE